MDYLQTKTLIFGGAFLQFIIKSKTIPSKMAKKKM
jgi:hypothetical protein